MMAEAIGFLVVLLSSYIAVYALGIITAILFVSRDTIRNPAPRIDAAIGYAAYVLDRVFMWCIDTVSGNRHTTISKRKLKKMLDNKTGI